MEADVGKVDDDLLGEEYPVILDDVERHENSGGVIFWLSQPLPVLQLIVELPSKVKFNLDIIGCQFDLTRNNSETLINCYSKSGERGNFTCSLPRCNPPIDIETLHCTDNCQPYVGTEAVYTCKDGYSPDPSSPNTELQLISCFSNLTTNHTNLQQCSSNVTYKYHSPI